jgi:hypothetical protein
VNDHQTHKADKSDIVKKNVFIILNWIFSNSKTIDQAKTDVLRDEEFKNIANHY